MHRPIVDPLPFILVIVALAGAAWLYVQKEYLRHDLAAAAKFRSAIEQEARATGARALQAESAKAKAERLLTDVGDELMAAQRAKEAAALALKQVREQLIAQKDTFEARLKIVTDELAQTRAAKEAAEAAATKARQPLEKAQTEKAEQTSPD